MDIGVAIPVPSPWGDELRHARLGFGDEQARAIPTHITLVPPFTMPRSARGEVADHLAAAAAATAARMDDEMAELHRAVHGD